MAPARDLRADIWRAACRHMAIDSSVRSIARAIAGHVPLDTLRVLRVDVAMQSVECLAEGCRDGAAGTAVGSIGVPPAAWRALAAWLRSEEVLHVGAKPPPPWLREIARSSTGRDLLAGPLRAAQGPSGILLLVARAGASFSAADARVVAELLEPLAVALENDGRLHELRALREAAEADRQTLLTRLGRQDVNEEVVGARTGLKHVMDRVELVAASDVPVLILGETGTGKEVVSRAIHARSKRADGPFIRVNCGAIPPELIDSQLFGHEKGSFTGAAEQHQGWFERADRGTLFLDEIGELPLPAQVRLLRVLQDHQIERVGGRAPLHVDVRIVAATHRDLAAMVKERTFREDLWYRINVFPVLLPRLRERLEDIPELARHFARRAAARFGLPPAEPTEPDLRLLAAYDWPGNIRELGAVIDRAAILGGGRRLDVAVALGLSRQQGAGATATTDATLFEVIPEEPTFRDARADAPADAIEPLATAMRRHIERALAARRGRVEGRRGAAAILQINPHTLRARMRKLGIDPGRFRD